MVTAQKIQMVDLKTQYEKIKSEVDNGIQEVINNTAFINGPAVKEFQKDLEDYLHLTAQLVLILMLKLKFVDTTRPDALFE